MNRRMIASAAVICALLYFATAHAAVLKLGTVVPKDSSYEKVLRDMGVAWSRIPGGVGLKIHAGGTMGGEADMVSKMRIGQLDAALLTANGLADIDPAVRSLQSMPMMFRSLDEVDYVGEKLRGRLDRRLADKGFVVLFWVDTGWVRFFSVKPIHTPADLKAAKLFTWAGDTQAFDIYKSAGFHPVALEPNDILPMLRTGMITAVPSPPYVALATQTWTVAKNVTLIDWAPLVGALVVTEKSWNQLPPSARAEMTRVAHDAGVRMKAENRAASNAAIEEMKKRRVAVYQPTRDEIAAWRKAAEATYPQIRGTIVPADFFDEVQRLLADYRATNTASK